MNTSFKQKLLLAIYFISPIIATIIYWIEEPVSWSVDQLLHRTASILGIFSYIWMCFNIIMISRIKMIHNSFKWKTIIKFHTIMATIALIFGGLHAPLLLLTGSFPENILVTGTIGILIFLVLMIMAIIFMTNRAIQGYAIKNLRLKALERNYSYRMNKMLHNITMAAVLFIFIHTLIAFSAAGSDLIRLTYSFFFAITLISWVGHKLVTKLRIDSKLLNDYYAMIGEGKIAKASKLYEEMRANGYIVPVDPPKISQIMRDLNPEWSRELIKNNPSLYSCFQCNTCTEHCALYEVSDGAYNPRLIIQASLLGLEKALIKKQSIDIWLCSTCQRCVEDCPEHIELSEIFTHLKNEIFHNGGAPESYVMQAKTVFDYGLAIPKMPAIMKRREKMGLNEPVIADIDEIQKLMKATHLDMNELGG